jgi:2-polyprenyl-3-methyl-5-hydroxy-6-metoxy-1,4-benzoquinol methylase
VCPDVDPSDKRRRLHFQYENPREDVQAVVPPDARRILDIGCSSGAVGAALKARQDAEVVGVEIDPAYAADAEERLDRVMVADVEEMFGGPDPPDLGEFDCLVAADVLEHLRDPWLVLRQAVRLVRPGGSAVVSLPNVRFWDMFWQVGKRATWPQHDHGLFDRTHLRFFTVWDARGLLDQAGLDVVEVAPQYRLRREPSSFDRRLRILDRTKNLGAFFAFQYVLRGVRRPS